MFRKGAFLLFFIGILGNFTIAQNIRFNEAFPIIPGLAASSLSIMVEPNGYIIYGITLDSKGHQDIALSKIDSTGNILWKKSYPKASYNFLPYAVCNELGINIPWGGEIGEIDWYNDTVSSLVCWGLYRFDGNGDTVWTRNYADSTFTLTDEIKITRDEKYLIYGAWINYADRYQGFCTLFLRKTDSLGNLIWTRTYHYSDSLTREASGIDTCKDGGYILCAYEKDTNTNYSKINCWDGKIMIMKTDSGGNIKWTKYIPNPICDVRAFSIRTLKNGGYLVSGFWDDSLNWNGDIAFSHMYMAKLNDTGSIVWSNTYGLINEEGHNVLNDVRELPNGDIIACGFGDSLLKPQPGAILRTDSNGNQKWLRYYYKVYPTDEDYLTDILYTHNGGFIASGYTYDNPENFWVVKTDSMGCDTIGCNYTGLEQFKESVGEVKVYPNPNNGSFTISFLNINGKWTVEIYDVLGESIYTAVLNSDNTEISLKNQPPGIYFYRILTHNEALIGSGKLIIE